MNYKIIIISLLLSVCGMAIAENAQTSDRTTYQPLADIDNLRQAKAALIPYPLKAQWQDGEYKGNSITTKISKLPFSESQEAYSIEINSSGIAIQANHQRGLFYAEKTLEQLSAANKGTYPYVSIEDAPAYGIRGVMHDVGRNFQPIELLKEQLRHLARYKINTFHWHLSDHPGWRIEAIKHPRLNDPNNYRQSRDPGMYYSYAEIRDFITYANSLNINVIPELDMPGHSDYFTKAFGFTMGSQQGRQICLELLQEFFDHVPRELAPIIHLGADEVKIDDPKGFIQLMVDKIEGDGRTAVVWEPGLAPLSNTIVHTWKGDNHFAERKNIDSVHLYTNLMDPFNALNQVYFKRVNPQHAFDNPHSLGAIVATWNDVNVDQPADVLRNNPFYTSALTAAEVLWKGNRTGQLDYQYQFPPRGSVEHQMLAEFEGRLLFHREHYFNNDDSIFFYRPQFTAEWKLKFSLPNTLGAEKRDKLTNQFNQQLSEYSTLGGNTLVLKTRSSREEPPKGYLRNAPVGTKVTAQRLIYSDQPKKVKLHISLTTPERSHRMWQGTPEQGQWDAFGGTVSLNGELLSPTEWRHPGKHKVLKSVWKAPIKEVPWNIEELYWLREPIEVQLKAGQNILELESVFGFKKQLWQLTAWVEDID